MIGSRVGRWLLYAGLALLAVLHVLPLVWAILTSVRSLDEAYAIPPSLSVGSPRWSNYVEAFETLPFARYMANSVVISVAAVTGAVLTSSMAGFAFARLRWRGRRFWFVVLLVTMMLPSQVLLIAHYLLFDRLGWIDTYKPLIVPSWLGGGAFNVFLFRQFFRTIPREVEDAAVVDGASGWQCYWHVFLPIAKPAVIVAAALSFLYHWRSLMHPLLYLSDFERFPVSVGLRMYQTLAGTWINLLMGASLVSMVPVLIVFAVSLWVLPASKRMV